MPEYGVEFGESFKGEDADVRHLVERWRQDRRRVRKAVRGQQVELKVNKLRFWAPAIAEDDLAFLARCARNAWFLDCPPESLGSLVTRPGSQTTSLRMARVFAECPDEAALFWTWMRHQRRLKADTKLRQARDAVRYFRIEALASGQQFTQAEIESYLEKKYGGGEWSSSVEDALQAERGQVSGKKSGRNPGLEG